MLEEPPQQQPSYQLPILYRGANGQLQSRGGGGDGEIPPSEIRAFFGSLWFKKGTAPDPNLSDRDYKQQLNRAEKYEHQSNELLSRLMTANVMNNRNLWIISCMMPLVLTNAQHFHINHREYNALPYTPKAEGGTDNQITHTEWQTTDSIGPILSQSSDISVRLSRDDDYGVEVWRMELNQLDKDLALTLMLEALRDCRNVAYQQISYDAEYRFSAERLHIAESYQTMLAADDPDKFLELVKEEAIKHGLNLMVVNQDAVRFLRMAQNQKWSERPLVAKEMHYNPNEKRLVAKNHKGPMSLMTLEAGDGKVDVAAVEPFRVNSQDPVPYKPLSTPMVQCQYFDANPFLRADTRAAVREAKVLNQWISHQTPEGIQIKCIDFRDQLRNCFYWDPETGKISEYVERFIATLNNKRVKEAPWQFQQGSRDVNDDKGDYAEPSQAARAHTGDLTKLTQFRHQPAVCMYDPNEMIYRPVTMPGNNNLAVLPHREVMPVPETLRERFHKEEGIYPSQVVGAIAAWFDNVSRTPFTQTYLEKLIDANMGAVVRNGPATDNGLPEFQPNANGGLRLPNNDDGSLTGMKYAPGFQSGAGMLTARDFQLQPGSAFREMCEEATAVLRMVQIWIDFLKRHLGNTDVCNPAMAKPWFLRKNAESVFIDALFPGQEPVFLGVPRQADTSATFGGGADQAARSDAFARQAAGGIKALLIRTPLADVTTADLLAERQAGGVVDASIEAVACLASAPYGDQFKNQMLAWQESENEAYRSAFSELFRFIIATCRFPKNFAPDVVAANATANENNKKVVTGVAAEFMAKLGDGNTEQIAAARKYIDYAKLPRNSQALIGKLSGTPAYESSAPSLAAALAAALAESVPSTLNPMGGDPNRTRTQQRTVEQTRASMGGRDGGRLVSYFEGAYDDAPADYLRSPLMSTPGGALEAFILDTGSRWALPGDAASNYTTPNLRAGGRAQRTLPTGAVVKTELASHLTGFRAHMGSTAVATQPTAGTGPSSRATLLEKRRKATAAQLFSFEAGPVGAEDDEYDRDEAYVAPTRKSTTKKTGGAPTPAEQEEATRRNRYYGPWASRIAFAEAIPDRFDRLNYMAVLQTPNTLDLHERLAGLGVSLLNIVLFRPFFKRRVSSAILMATGEDVCAKIISPIDVDMSKNRDQFRVECSLQQGAIFVDPSKVRMLYACFPESYESGGTTDFLTEPRDYMKEDACKGALIAQPVPITEREHAGWGTMTNRPLGGGSANRGRERCNPKAKFSCGEFFRSVFNERACDLVETLTNERDSYVKKRAISHTAFRGPRTVYDPDTCQMVAMNGFGPAQSMKMNCAEAASVYQQVPLELFPQNRHEVRRDYRTNY